MTDMTTEELREANDLAMETPSLLGIVAGGLIFAFLLSACIAAAFY